MKKDILNEKDCIIFEVLNMLSKRWNTFILLEFSRQKNKPIRYNELKLSLKKITSRSLSIRLKELESWNIIKKKEIKIGKIVNVYYSLTKYGRELLPNLIILRNWAKTVKTCKIEDKCNKCDFIGKCTIKR